MATPSTYGTSFEPLTGRDESWAETTDYNFQGKSWIVRITALHPYKDFANNGDELRAHIDVLNVTDGVSGRYADRQLPDRAANPTPQNEQHLRRHSTYAKLNQLLAQEPFDVTPSPVYP